MRLVVTENITLDGVVDLSDTWFRPAGAGGAHDVELEAELRRQDETCDAMLLGRRTFEDFRAYWPRQLDDTTGITAQLNRVTKYVVSSTMDDPGWANSVVLRGPLAGDVSRLRAAPGADVVVTGSVSVVRELVGSGVVDEYRLVVHPAIAGHGRRLFDGSGALGLDLTESRRFASGVLLLRYVPA
ncbi:dihydrofolate reductase family protein [Cellulomonas sp. URHE0023]|uniref:dihydrofolate reductase family protein n=1 Tax=Cellulomonas sp. URHE0023 TaxID=1380354 RepID=UPI00048965E5|nr:dihydrofolate reductase family protein [Cellulomonas sp. URHE0023]